MAFNGLSYNKIYLTFSLTLLVFPDSMIYPMYDMQPSENPITIDTTIPNTSIQIPITVQGIIAPNGDPVEDIVIYPYLPTKLLATSIIITIASSEINRQLFFSCQMLNLSKNVKFRK